jgi:hypothetical protein
MPPVETEEKNDVVFFRDLSSEESIRINDAVNTLSKKAEMEFRRFLFWLENFSRNANR